MKIAVFTRRRQNSWSKSISYCTSDLVSAQMGDRLAGTPYRQRNKHPGLHSVSLYALGRQNEYLGQSGEGVGVHRHIM